MNYTIIVGTHRDNSNSRKVGNFYKTLLEEKGIESQIIDMKDLPKDFIYSNMFGKRTDEFQKYQDIINTTNKFVFIIPEYNGSFPGILKTFIDSCDFPSSFEGKKSCLVGLSAGQFGNLRGLEHFTGVANYVKMDVCHSKMYLPGIDKDINDNGEISNPTLVGLINSQIEEFIKF